MTHLTVTMGNYLTGACGYRTAVLEWGGRETFAVMERVCTGRGRAAQPFSLLDVDYFTEADEKVLTACMNRDYQRIIIDFGDIREEDRTEFSRCGRQYLVASLCEWQIEAFWAFLREDGMAGRKGWMYLAAFGSEETRREIIRRLKLSIERIPLSVDAFTLTKEMMDWFERILAAHV